MKKFSTSMTLAALTTWLALAVPFPASAQGSAADSVETDLLRIQSEWAAARVARDVGYLDRLYAKEFRVQALNGKVVQRAEDIANFASGDLKPEFVRDSEMQVSQYGETAIVTGVEDLGGTYRGNRGEYSLRFTNVFVRRDGRWQLVLHHATPIPKKPAQGAAKTGSG